jgi:hypothetical protein
MPLKKGPRWRPSCYQLGHGENLSRASVAGAARERFHPSLGPRRCRTMTLALEIALFSWSARPGLPMALAAHRLEDPGQVLATPQGCRVAMCAPSRPYQARNRRLIQHAHIRNLLFTKAV